LIQKPNKTANLRANKAIPAQNAIYLPPFSGYNNSAVLLGL
jgi:hypothetical protein